MDCSSLKALCFVSVFGVVLLAATTPASAERWVHGHHSSCVSVCEAKDMEAVESGRYTNHQPFTICRADAAGEGRRPGYNLEPDWADKCFVAHGGREIGIPRYDCLCRWKRDRD
jgi:hypothetical protein